MFIKVAAGTTAVQADLGSYCFLTEAIPGSGTTFVCSFGLITQAIINANSFAQAAVINGDTYNIKGYIPAGGRHVLDYLGGSGDIFANILVYDV